MLAMAYILLKQILKCPYVLHEIEIQMWVYSGTYSDSNFGLSTILFFFVHGLFKHEYCNGSSPFLYKMDINCL